MARCTLFLFATAGLAAVALAGPVRADRPTSQISCAVLENGEPATGTLRVSRGTTLVHTGTCGGAVAVPPGDYSVVVGLDGALDGPEQTFAVTVRAAETKSVKADFATGVLQVRIASEGQQAAGMAIIRRAGKQLGTLGSGVTAHLSVGVYEVVARYRLKSQEFSAVTIARGQTTALDAQF